MGKPPENKYSLGELVSFSPRSDNYYLHGKIIGFHEVDSKIVYLIEGVNGSTYINVDERNMHKT